MVGNVLALNPVTLTLGGFAPQPMAQGFTSRSAVTYTEQVEGIRDWILNDLIPFLEENSSQAVWDANAALLQQAVNDAISTEQGTVTKAMTDAVTEVINATITVTDPIVTGLVNNLQSATRILFDTLYVSRAINRRNSITGWWHVDDFGAKGDGITDDRGAIQAAVDAANAYGVANTTVQRVFFADRQYMVGVTNYMLNGSQYGIVSINLKDYVELNGPGRVKCMAGAYGTGALYSLVRSPAEVGISHAGIRGLTIDGNRSGNISDNQAGCVTLDVVDDIWVVDCNIFESNGNGVMVRGKSSAPMTNVRIENNRVKGANTIGIQASQFTSLSIRGNFVSNTSDNGIDIYGENGTTNSSGTGFIISHNHVDSCPNGIFLETVAAGVVTDNRIHNMTGDGIHINRINGTPSQITVANNYIANTSNAVYGTGVAAQIYIHHNMMVAFNTAGVKLGGASDMAGYFITDNMMNGNTDTTALVLVANGTPTWSQSMVYGNITQSKNRAYDCVNYATTTVNVTTDHATSPGDTLLPGA